MVEAGYECDEWEDEERREEDTPGLGDVILKFGTLGDDWQGEEGDDKQESEMDRLLCEVIERNRSLEAIAIEVRELVQESKDFNRLEDKGQETMEMARRLDEIIRDTGRAVEAAVTNPTSPLDQPGPPLPPTRSPVTFTGLLPAVKEEGFTAPLIQWIVDEMMMMLEVPFGARADDRCRRWTGTMGALGAEALWCDAKMLIAGTDMLGFCFPPDGSKNWDANAGTDVRSYRHPLDLVARLSETLDGHMRLGSKTMVRSNVVGIDVRCFHSPLDSMPVMVC